MKKLYLPPQQKEPTFLSEGPTLTRSSAFFIFIVDPGLQQLFYLLNYFDFHNLIFEVKVASLFIRNAVKVANLIRRVCTFSNMFEFMSSRHLISEPSICIIIFVQNK